MKRVLLGAASVTGSKSGHTAAQQAWWRTEHVSLSQNAAVAAASANCVIRRRHGETNARPRTHAGMWTSVASVLAVLMCGVSATQAADCVRTIGSSSITSQVGCPTGSTTNATDKASVTVNGVAIGLSKDGGATNGIAAMTAGGDATATITNVNILNLRNTGPSLGINVTVDSPTNTATTGVGILTMTGTNTITIGQFTDTGGRVADGIGAGGGTLVNVRGSGDASTTISGTLSVLLNTGMGGGQDSRARDDGVETTVRSGTATLDMRELAGDSIVSVNGGNGLLIDSLRSSPTQNAGNVVVLGVSSALTVNVDNTQFGGTSASTVNGGNPVANAGIMAATFGSGTVDVQGTAATINTTGPLADGIHAISQLGTVSLANSGNITTGGISSHGIEANTTNGAYGTELYSFGGIIPASNANMASGAVSVTNSGAITTSGGGTTSTASHGIYAWTQSLGSGDSGTVTVVNKAGGDITTAGDFSNAIRAESSSTSGAAGAITVSNKATLATSGASADGIAAIASGTSGGDVSVTNSGTIKATGVNANGIAATTTAGRIAIANRGSVTSSQASAIQAVGGDSANLTIKNKGSIFGGTAGISIAGFATAQIDNSGTIGASNDLAIEAINSTAVSTINNSGTITGYVTLGNGVNTMNNSGLWNLRNFDTGVLGVAVADFGNSGSNTVNNSGTLALLGAPTAGATVNTTGQYLPLAAGSVRNAVTGNSANAMAANGPVQGQLLGVQTFNNSGVIDLTANKAVGDVLVITGGHSPGLDGGGVFVANGGSLRINTVLNEGGPNSQSDMLVVDSTKLGTAPVGIVVNNAGGLGAKTVGDGIAVVEVLNKTASANGVFALSGRTAAGAYDYGLFHNGLGLDDADGNWYLRSQLRPEVAVDTVVPALASKLGLAMLGSVWARDGSFGPGEFCADPTDPRKDGLYVKARRPLDECHTLLWGRVFGEVGSAGSGGDGQGGLGKAGPAYNFQYGGVEAGADLYRSARDRAGLYAGVVTGQADVAGVTNAWAGRVGMDSYGFGGYWTHRDPGGWYTDVVLQGNWYDNIRANTVGGQSIGTQGWGITVSGETGYAVALGGSWSVIPQAQLVYQRIALDGAADQFGRIDYPATDEVYGRLGTRLAKGWVGNDGRLITTWLDTNFWHQFGNDAHTTFTDLQGLNPTTLSASLGGTWAQVGLGLSGQVTRNVSIFGTGDYNLALTQPGHSLGGRAGVRFTW